VVLLEGTRYSEEVVGVVQEIGEVVDSLAVLATPVRRVWSWLDILEGR